MPTGIYKRVKRNKQNKVKTHGFASKFHPNNRTYRIWQNMNRRCKSDPLYKNISVCDKWKKFKGFLEDIGIIPDGLEIDRFPDKNGNYCKENVRLANRSEQNENRNPYNKLKIKGLKKTSSGKYMAYSNENGKQIYLGSFVCPLLASAAYRNFKGDRN